MMNAAIFIAPAPQTGSTSSAGKAPPGQGELFGQAMAQQQQVVYQAAEQHTSLSGSQQSGSGVHSFSEFWGNDSGAFFDLEPHQQEVLTLFDRELLDDLALLLEQGVVPNSMDQDKLQQLVDLIEEVLPQWQFHNQESTELEGEKALSLETDVLTPEQQLAELVELFNHSLAFAPVSDKPQQSEQGLTAAQRLDQVIQQVRAAMQQAGSKEDHVQVDKGVVQNRGTDLLSADVRMMEIPVKNSGDEATKSPLEARFSELLKPRQQYAPQLRSGESGHYSQQQQQQPQSAATSPEEAVFNKGAEKTEGSITAHNVATTATQVVDGSGQQTPLHVQQSPVVATQVVSTPTPAASVFAGSRQVSDSQIFDQVVTHLSGSSKGEAGRMVLRLHPAELGALRIELMVEGDRVRANLHAQSQQVQEVLERNMGQLRSALAEQGLKIDHFQVSSDTRQNQHQEQAQDLARQRAEAELLAEAERKEQENLPEDQSISLEHLLQNGGRGISLHV